MPITQANDYNDTTIVGGTDATVIGNSGNRLLVDSQLSSAVAPTYSSTYRLIHVVSTINLSGAAYQNVYSYTGSGKLINFVINSSSDDLEIKVTINGITIFENFTAKEINDFGIRSVYNLPVNGTGAGSFHFVPNYPIQFTSSMQILARRITGGNMTISRYLITMTQES